MVGVPVAVVAAAERAVVAAAAVAARSVSPLRVANWSSKGAISKSGRAVLAAMERPVERRVEAAAAVPVALETATMATPGATEEMALLVAEEAPVRGALVDRAFALRRSPP